MTLEFPTSYVGRATTCSQTNPLGREIVQPTTFAPTSIEAHDTEKADGYSQASDPRECYRDRTAYRQDENDRRFESMRLADRCQCSRVTARGKPASISFEGRSWLNMRARALKASMLMDKVCRARDQKAEGPDKLHEWTLGPLKPVVGHVARYSAGTSAPRLGRGSTSSRVHPPLHLGRIWIGRRAERNTPSRRRLHPDATVYTVLIYTPGWLFTGDPGRGEQYRYAP